MESVHHKFVLEMFVFQENIDCIPPYFCSPLFILPSLPFLLDKSQRFVQMSGHHFITRRSYVKKASSVDSLDGRSSLSRVGDRGGRDAADDNSNSKPTSHLFDGPL
jgi:hypothetical protein